MVKTCFAYVLRQDIGLNFIVPDTQKTNLSIFDPRLNESRVVDKKMTARANPGEGFSVPFGFVAPAHARQAVSREENT